ncbi:MAG TPA: hypothetical protein DHV62_03445 [Elusimicrobia bacterium]|nr:hypothetical protein [Elusimicrobiota bacterium]
MITRMAKVEIIGPKVHFFDCLGVLHHLGILHIEQVVHRSEEEKTLFRPMVHDPEHAEQLKQLEGLSTRVNSTLAHLPAEKIDHSKKELLYKELWRESSADMAKEIDSAITGMEEQIRNLASEKYNLEMEIATLSKYEPMLAKIHPLTRHLKTYEGFESIALLVDRKFKAGLDELKEELEKITKKQCELITADLDEETTGAIVVFNRLYTKAVHDFLSLENVTQVRLPPDLAKMHFEDALATVREKSKNIPVELEKINRQLKEISESWYLRLVTIAEILRNKVEEIKLIPKFGETNYAFVITGWMPKKDIPWCKDTLEKEFSGRVYLHEVKLTSHEWEEAPVALSNPKLVKPFEFFYKLVGIPKYGTVDPTFFLTFFFPFLFGMIIGDTGYGLVMLFTSIWLKKKYVGRPFTQTLASIMRLASISTIIWGILFFELFGNLGEKIIHALHIPMPHFELFGVLTLPLLRERAILPLLVIAIAVGILHVGIGLIFGIINGIQEHQPKHSFEKAGLFSIFVFGPLVLLVGIMTKSFLVKIGGLLIVLGVGATAYGGSVKGIIEIFGTLSNIFSYARLMALGVAGAILASVSNELAKEIGGIGGMVASALGIFLAVFLHSINVVLHGLSASIHSMRLNLLEAFTKFFEPAKKVYQPFQRSEI